MAQYSLNDIQDLATKFMLGESEKIQFTAPTKSVESVSKTLLVSADEAEKIIALGLLKLTSNDFSHLKYQWSSVFDVYGLERYHSHNWYIKFAIYTEDGLEYLEDVSFHPVIEPLRLLDGRVLAVSFGGGNRNE